MGTQESNAVLLLSGRHDKFLKTYIRILNAFDSHYGKVDLVLNLWEDKFVGVDPRFNSDPNHWRDCIVDDRKSISYLRRFKRINSFGLTSNHLMLDFYEKINSECNFKLDVSAFIKYFAPIFKTLRVINTYVNTTNRTHSTVIKSRFDLLVGGEVANRYDPFDPNTIYVKFANSFVDQEIFLCEQTTVDTFHKLTDKQIVEIFARYFNEIYYPAMKAGGKQPIHMYPEFCWKYFIESIGCKANQWFPFQYTGIYRNHLDDTGDVKSIRERNIRDGAAYSWK